MKATDYTVKVNGQSVAVYNSPGAAYVYFSTSEAVNVEVTPTATVSTYKILPASLGIVGSKTANTVAFSLASGKNVCFEANGNYQRPLFIFANPLETYTPAPPPSNDANVIYFGPGYHNIGILNVGWGKTVYIAGGAVVRGRIVATGAADIAIRGRGILWQDGSVSGRPLDMGWVDVGSTGKLYYDVRDIIVQNDTTHWSVVANATRDVSISNLKVVSYNPNYTDDGIDINGVYKTSITGCFIYSNDDCIAVKNDHWVSPDNNRTNFITNDLTVSNCVLFNREVGVPIRVGGESNSTEMHNMTFSNLDILHARWWGTSPPTTDTATAQLQSAAIVIESMEGAWIHNITFDNLRIEGTDKRTFSFLVRSNAGDPIGKISDVVVKNVTVSGGTYTNSVLWGYDSSHRISNVTFDHLRIGGNLVTNAAQGNMDINGSTSNIVFIPSATSSSVTVEAENLTVASSTANVSTATSSDASGGSYHTIDANADFQAVTYTVNIPTAATYYVQLRFLQRPDAGKVRLEIDGSAVGPFGGWDQYQAWYGWSDYVYGSKALSAGSHTVTLKVTGKNASSSGLKMTADKFTFFPDTNKIVLEAENITPTAGAAYATVSDGLGTYHRLDATALYQSISYPVTITQAGTYFFNLKFTRRPDAGRVRLEVDGQGVGVWEGWDQFQAWYDSSDYTYGSKYLGTGSHTITLKVASQNPASSGLKATVDKITLFPLS
jgi:hypothetical protein